MKKSISNFLNNEAREFSLEVLYNRAIPHLIDGFKPSQRLLFSTGKNLTSYIKTSALVGQTIANGYNEHGDASLYAALNLMTQNFTGSNQISVFSGKGNFGDRLVQEAASGRYTSVKINPQFLNLFNDFDLVDYTLDNIPVFFLPIIPTVLLNGIEGIAVGFSTLILPRNIKTLVQVLKDKLENNKVFSKEFYKPCYPGYKGKIYYHENKWMMEGVFERVKENKIRIIEVPIKYDREKYITLLDNLIDKGIIKSYKDNSKYGFDIYVKLNKELTPEKIIEVFGLKMALNEMIYVINEKGELKKYESPDDLINDFIKYRLTIYTKRIAKIIQKSKNDIEFIDEKVKFIKMLMAKKINFLTQSKNEIMNYLKEQGFKYGKEVLMEKVFKFSKDEIDKLKAHKEELIEKIKYYENTNEKIEYIKDLGELK